MLVSACGMTHSLGGRGETGAINGATTPAAQQRAAAPMRRA